MKKILSSLLLVVLSTQLIIAQDYTKHFDGTRMRDRVIRLSADDFEGRGPGTDGGKRAAQYIADQMKASGIKPGNGSSYFQNVKLIGLKADPNTRLQVGNESYKFGDDFVATTSAQRPEVSIDADLVFAGYGIDAPNYKWSDYGESADFYRGKVLMIMFNDPPATESEPDLFGNKALTYYGRWTYKFEEAARRGAAGVIL
ncbi:MAG: peptidase M28, partial [Pyrinomonadaceae bacterium]